jgi:hypothetical protein
MTRGSGLCSQHTLRSGSDRDSGADRRGGNFSRIHGDSRFSNRLSAHKCLLWNCRYRALHATVYISHIRDRRGVVDDRRVVNIRDLRDIHRRITDVHLRHVRLADVVGGHENFARS